MAAANRSVGILSKGDVAVQRWENGVLNPQIIKLSAIKLDIKVEAELLERKGKGRANWNQTTGAVGSPKGVSASLAIDSVSSEIMALMLMGTAADLTVAGGTVTAESVTAVHDVWVKLAQRNISGTAIAGSVLGTDYLEDKNFGAIMVLSTGNIANNTAISVDYTYSGITGKRIAAGVQSQVDIALMFDGEFLEDQSQVFVRIPKMSIIPKSDFSLLSDKYVEPEFDCKVVKLASEIGAIIFDDNLAYA